MKFNPNIHHRRSTRLQGYDYTQSGAYFVTFCTYQRNEIFGKIIHAEMKLSALGRIVHEEWIRSMEFRKEIRLFDEEFMIMPNHCHGIVWITAPAVGADGVRTEQINVRMPCAPTGTSQPFRQAPHSLGSFMAGFKASVTSRARRELNMTEIWQRNYYDHIIRDDRALNNIRQYITDNPRNWQADRDNSRNLRKLCPPERMEDYLIDVEGMSHGPNEKSST